jgi:peptidoglycan biosynthesis protein MviN/MurJ (putative lipid II flippase)
MKAALIWILSYGLSVAGLLGSGAYLWFYLRRGTPRERKPLEGHRPWRPVGALLCAAISVLFYAGLHVVSAEQRPGLYLLVWALILLMLAGVCVLAIVDMLYTRRLLREMRGGSGPEH